MRWARVRDGTLDYFEFLAEFPTIQTQIRHWLTLGLTVSSSHTVATCRLLLAAEADLWRFVSVPGLEPTNNSAERALRHAVIWRRSSHGTQSDHGSRFVERILTVVETCRQQQRPVFAFFARGAYGLSCRSTGSVAFTRSLTLGTPPIYPLNAYGRGGGHPALRVLRGDPYHASPAGRATSAPRERNRTVTQVRHPEFRHQCPTHAGH